MEEEAAARLERERLAEQGYLLNLRRAMDRREDVFEIVCGSDLAHAVVRIGQVLRVDEETATAIVNLRLRDFSDDSRAALDQRIADLSA